MENETVSKNFIENIIDKDLAEGVYDTVHTRFPPEPNGPAEPPARCVNAVEIKISGPDLQGTSSWERTVERT